MIPETLPLRIQRALIETSTGCWDWQLSRNKGYGQVMTASRIPAPAHRFVYELLVGPIPPGRHLHHKCHNRGCCNPAHLELMTASEHSRLHNVAIEICKHGHAMDEANTYVRANGQQQCRACKARREAARRALDPIAHDQARAERRRRQRAAL